MNEEVSIENLRDIVPQKPSLNIRSNLSSDDLNAVNDRFTFLLRGFFALDDDLKPAPAGTLTLLIGNALFYGRWERKADYIELGIRTVGKPFNGRLVVGSSRIRGEHFYAIDFELYYDGEVLIDGLEPFEDRG